MMSWQKTSYPEKDGYSGCQPVSGSFRTVKFYGGYYVHLR